MEEGIIGRWRGGEKMKAKLKGCIGNVTGEEYYAVELSNKTTGLCCTLRISASDYARMKIEGFHMMNFFRGLSNIINAGVEE